MSEYECAQLPVCVYLHPCRRYGNLPDEWEPPKKNKYEETVSTSGLGLFASF